MNKLIHFLLTKTADNYTIRVTRPKFVSKFSKDIKKKSDAVYHNDKSNEFIPMYHKEHHNFGELQDHDTSYIAQSQIHVPLKILSPITSLIWMFMCPNWRNNCDFNFDRPDNFNNDSTVTRFNDTLYVKYHNLFDWHEFALLNNGTFLYANAIIDPKIPKKNKVYYFIVKIDYAIPHRLLNAQSARVFRGIDGSTLWKPDCNVSYRKLICKDGVWTLRNRVYVVSIHSRIDWVLIDSKTINLVLPQPKFQHPSVASNKPFIFAIFGSDKYHHTVFTGREAMTTHGGYWWIGNYDPELQFKKMFTFITFQAPSIVGLSKILPKMNLHWQHLMNKGCVAWDGNQMTPLHGMLSHQIGDMQDRDIFLRKRGNNIHSRSDGMLWSGFREGSSWPVGVSDLLTLGSVIPGQYLMKVWKFIHVTCVQRGLWAKPSDNIGKSISLTMNRHDVYNELPLDSTLKSPLELNHTTLLGLLTSGFGIEWVYIHNILKFDEKKTKVFMVAYLQKYWNNINGIGTFLSNINCDIMVFNQMQHSWQKMLEIMISLPHVVNWIGNLDLLSSLIRMTGCLFACKTENERLRLKNIVKNILSQGSKIHL